jgi:hypothetical protein
MQSRPSSLSGPVGPLVREQPLRTVPGTLSAARPSLRRLAAVTPVTACLSDPGHAGRAHTRSGWQLPETRSTRRDRNHGSHESDSPGGRSQAAPAQPPVRALAGASARDEPEPAASRSESPCHDRTSENRAPEGGSAKHCMFKLARL